MRLAARVDVDLDVRMLLLDPREQPFQRRSLLARQEREDLVAAVEQPLDDRRRPRRRSRRRDATAVPSARPSQAPFRTGTPSSSTSREAVVTSPVTTASSASRIARSFSSAELVGR